MTCDEFSREFDILYNNITSNQAPALNSYEKSVFLTNAQESFILSCYNGNGRTGFEGTEAFTSYLSHLTVTKKFSATDVITTETPITKDYQSLMVNLDNDAWFIVYESATVIPNGKGTCYPNGKEVSVLPITYDTLDRAKKDPFRKPNERKILRVSRDGTTSTSLRSIELLCNNGDTFESYLVKYVKKPTPIVLANLETEYSGLGLTVDTVNVKTECKLPASTHRAILFEAVQLAKAAYMASSGNVQTQDNNS